MRKPKRPGLSYLTWMRNVILTQPCTLSKEGVLTVYLDNGDGKLSPWMQDNISEFYGKLTAMGVRLNTVPIDLTEEGA